MSEAAETVGVHQITLATRRSQLCRWYVGSVMVLLVLTALAKLVSALGTVRVLNTADPVFWFLTQRHMLFAAAVLELGVAATLWRGWRQDRYPVGWILWLSAIFIGYRFGLWGVGYHGHCPCLGHASDWLHLSAHTVDWMMKGMLAYMIAGAVAVALVGMPVTRSRPPWAWERHGGAGVSQDMSQ